MFVVGNDNGDHVKSNLINPLFYNEFGMIRDQIGDMVTHLF